MLQMRLSIVLLLPLSLLAFTLDTSSSKDTVEAVKPKVFTPKFKGDEKQFYDSCTLHVSAVVIDTLRIDFDVAITCNSAHGKREVLEKEEAITVIFRKMLLVAEARDFSVVPYEEELKEKVNTILSKGEVVKVSLVQKNIY